jgi:hypothetical protein
MLISHIFISSIYNKKQKTISKKFALLPARAIFVGPFLIIK